MSYTSEELKQAKFQITSTIHKLKQALISLEAKEDRNRYKSQITLTIRRIKAFEISLSLIEEKLQNIK